MVSLFFLPIFPKQRTMNWSPRHDSLLAISCTSHDVFWLWNKPGDYACQMMDISAQKQTLKNTHLRWCISAQKQTPKNMHLLTLIRVDVLLCIFSIVILKVEWNGSKMNISQSTWISKNSMSGALQSPNPDVEGVAGNVFFLPWSTFCFEREFHLLYLSSA